jgi:protein LSM14
VPFTVNQKSFTPPVQDAPAIQATSRQVQTKAEIDAATLKAKQAVQDALAKLPGNNVAKPAPVPTTASIDALAQKVGDLSTTANGTSRGRGGPRSGRGAYPRGGGAATQPARKIEIPKSDYDFESANKKFNKEDLIKEAIASGSPAGEDGPAEVTDDTPNEGIERKNSIPASNKAYNKSTSFFDNISSESRDREEHTDGRALARQNRADEFKKNVDTFGQGNVDGGYRGRGRGGYRGRQYGGNRGYRGGYSRGYGGRGGRGGQAQADPQAPPTTTPQIPS